MNLIELIHHIYSHRLSERHAREFLDDVGCGLIVANSVLATFRFSGGRRPILVDSKGNSFPWSMNA